MILPAICLTVLDTKRRRFIRADLIRGFSPLDENDPAAGSSVDVDGYAHPLKVVQSFEQIAGGLNAAIEWTQTRVIAAQAQLMERAAQQANGIAIARMNGIN